MDDKTEFATRLRAAMEAAGYQPRPSILEANFNSRYWGRSVTFQAARRWLIGLSIPTPEKIEVLGRWLGVDAHLLRYGKADTRSSVDREPEANRSTAWSTVDRAFLNDYLGLTVEHRRLVRELVAALARAG